MRHVDTSSRLRRGSRVDANATADRMLPRRLTIVKCAPYSILSGCRDLRAPFGGSENRGILCFGFLFVKTKFLFGIHGGAPKP